MSPRLLYLLTTLHTHRAPVLEPNLADARRAAARRF